MSDRTFILDYDYEQLEETLQSWGEPAYRARQIWQGIYQNLWAAPEDFTSLSLALRRRLAEHFDFSHLQTGASMESNDGQTIKTLFWLNGGGRDVEMVSSAARQAIEAVQMRYEKRNTLCISSQAGCAMGCVFCATGQMGFRRNLTGGEIIEQILYYARQLKIQGERVTNIVIMGMGEPFHNYEATFHAIDRINHPDGLRFGARRITVSTVGLVPAIQRFTQERRQVNLAVSLHAADDELRSSLLPINHKYPLDVLLEACLEYVIQTHRRITFEWALIHDVNDTAEQAQKLARKLAIFRGKLQDGHEIPAGCHVNVIPLNPTKRYSGQATTRERAQIFKMELERNGIPCTIRIRRGIDIQAGCGQLAIERR